MLATKMPERQRSRHLTAGWIVPLFLLIILCVENAAEVTLSSLTLASRTATTLNVTWSAGYPKCYSFTMFRSTQDGSITVTQPTNSGTSRTLSSLQPGTTYRIEVEAVRKGDRADGQRAKVMGSFTTANTTRNSSNAVPSGTISPTTASAVLPTRPTAPSETPAVAGAIVGGVIGGLLALVLILVAGMVAALLGFIVHRRKNVLDAKPTKPKTPSASQGSATQHSDDTKQTYAVLDWQNPEQRPVKAPDNEWFTVQYSEVHFASTK